MPVKNYRSVQELGDTGFVDPRSPELGRVIAGVWAFSEKIAPLQPVRGVRKLRSVEELNRHRLAWR